MRAHLLPAMAGLAAVMLVLGAVLLRAMRQEARLAARLLAVQQGAGLDQVAARQGLADRLLRLLYRAGTLLTESGVLSATTVRGLEGTLQSAGLRGDRALGIFVGAKILAVLGLPALAWLALLVTGRAGAWGAYALPLAAIAGLLAPDLVARRLRKRYLAGLERGLPDALDLMVICAEAGLALEATIERVAGEMRAANAPMATELALCNSEMRILPDRRSALTNMAERTKLDSLRRLAVTLSQSIRFGTPLVQAMKTLAQEMRQEQMTRFEARAARLPVLLTLPMIAFILPVLLIVAAGPALIEVMRHW